MDNSPVPSDTMPPPSDGSGASGTSGTSESGGTSGGTTERTNGLGQ
jgi:hypothetical protein